VENFEDLYTDYLITSTSYTTATGMASLLSVSHDKITRCLSQGVYDSKYLWEYVKPYVQELTQSEETIVLSFDDSIEEKRYTDESELICWHYDHTFGRSVRGVNFFDRLCGGWRNAPALRGGIHPEKRMGNRCENGQAKKGKHQDQE